MCQLKAAPGLSAPRPAEDDGFHSACRHPQPASAVCGRRSRTPACPCAAWSMRRSESDGTGTAGSWSRRAAGPRCRARRTRGTPACRAAPLPWPGPTARTTAAGRAPAAGSRWRRRSDGLGLGVVRLDDLDQNEPRNNAIHLLEKLALARLLHRQVQAKVKLLVHAQHRRRTWSTKPGGSARGLQSFPRLG